jgi:hypothetical protein
MDRELERCINWGAETTLYVSGEPVCLKCDKERDGRMREAIVNRQ